MSFIFDIEKESQKAGVEPANPANHANPSRNVGRISSFSKISNQPPSNLGTEEGGDGDQPVVGKTANPLQEATRVLPPLDRALQAELTRLVKAFGASEAFSQQDTEEALQVALADPDGAILFYQDRVRQLLLDTNPKREARRKRVLEMLTENPTTRYAVLTDMDADPQAVILTLAIRGEATFELRIPRSSWDGILFMELLDKQIEQGTVH